MSWKYVLPSSYPTMSSLSAPRTIVSRSRAIRYESGSRRHARHFLFSLQLTPLPVVLSPAPFDRGFLLLHRSNERRGNSTTIRMRLRNLSLKESTGEGWENPARGRAARARKQASPTTNSTALWFRLNYFSSPLSLALIIHHLSLPSWYHRKIQ